MRRSSCALLLSLIMTFFVCSLQAQVDVPVTQEQSAASDTSAIEGDQPPIALDATAVEDEDIQSRLSSILSEIEAMDDVSVDVSNSVVQLKGQVDSAEARLEAQSLADSLQGVVKVDNQVEVSRDVSQRVRSTWDRVIELASQIRSVLPILILSLCVFVLFWYLAGRVARLQVFWRKLAPNAFIATVFGTIARLLILLLGALVALYLLDATSIIATVLGAAGIVGLAVGFAVRDTVENFIASILLSIRQPFKMKDFVEINEHQGSVARLTGRATILISPSGNQIRIPNAIVFKSVITNYTRHPMRRFELAVPVDESEDLVKARQLAEKQVKGVNGVQRDPPPQVYIQELGETIISLVIQGWVDQREHDLMKVQTASAIAVKTAFRDAGIVMPQSVHTVTLIDEKRKRTAGNTEPAQSANPDLAKQTGSVRESQSNAPDARTTIDTRVVALDQDVVQTQVADEQKASQNLLSPN